VSNKIIYSYGQIRVISVVLESPKEDHPRAVTGYFREDIKEFSPGLGVEG